ncbi:polysaccharide deacetylase family protein [Pseudofrankia inefficax]|uniref:Polysaccharide deacetylase n=1 Tax=Pseudofrankia inefficax (strain DSM 45817 / CECT 9037 / DDB 130130 / EuI1c) TaxID=298654 RepID=E3J2L2_PSEI1|nr:polysaccharide deacetylase family protein [Pseudofrankia inefficax]ADP80526.1 polysaccharide deacetylase [Pseudofrankia inefficax]
MARDQTPGDPTPGAPTAGDQETPPDARRVPASRRQLLAGAGAVIATAGFAAACSSDSAAPAQVPAAASPVPTSPRPTPTAEPALTFAPVTAQAVANGPRDRNQVALTFHIGPHEAGQDVSLAHQLLDAATRLGVPITVFAVGQWLDEHADLVPALLASGNELDNHTFTHPTLTRLPAAQVAQEIVGCRDVLSRLAPAQGRYFRPSGTSAATPLIVEQAGAAGYPTVVDFDVDPLDYTSPGADAVVSRVRAGARPGSIVSMHFGYPGTVAAFPRIVANLRAAGLTPVTVHTLLA